MFVYCLLCVLACVVSFKDITTRLISNKLCVLVLLVNGLFLIIYSQQWQGIIIAALVLLIGSYVLRLSLIGGGDVKLIASFCISLNGLDFIKAIYLSILIGGALSLYYLGKRIICKCDNGVPYGVAISIGFCIIIATYLK
ncbi:A24 family peptidase [Vibrio nomapromontoriensis]|uniref:A24 family peptidase n=1 Tax=Vibrio nomapromontoriensis TaxID=2910246 RepID=UPI003D0D0EB9